MFSFGSGAGSASISPLTARLFGLRSIGIILGVVTCGFTIGATVGPIITCYLFDITKNYQVAFLLAAALAIVGLLLSVLIKPIGAERGTRQLPI